MDAFLNTSLDIDQRKGNDFNESKWDNLYNCSTSYFSFVLIIGISLNINALVLLKKRMNVSSLNNLLISYLVSKLLDANLNKLGCKYMITFYLF